MAGGSSSKKYPRRENRKPPAHLADVFGADLLFSTPDIIKRVVKTPSGHGNAAGGISEAEMGGMPVESASAALPPADVPNQQPVGKIDLLGIKMYDFKLLVSMHHIFPSNGHLYYLVPLRYGIPP